MDAFCRFIQDLPKERLASEQWGPREVLAHLVFHHESYLDQVKARLAERPFDPPRGKFRELNAQAVALFRGVPIERLLGRLREATRGLCELYEATDPHALVIEIKQGAKPRTLAELIPEVEAHIRNHQEKLKRGSKNPSKVYL